MKSLSFAVLLVSLTAANLSLSQQKINSYEPPAEIKGTSLTLYFDSHFMKMKDRGVSGSSVDGYIACGFQKWKYTDKNDLVVSIKPEISADWYTHSEELTHENYSHSSSRLSVKLEGGYDHYLVRKKLFSGLYMRTTAEIESGSQPNFQSDIYPLIGYGKIVNAINVNGTDNFEQVLLKEGIITKPLDKKVRKLLTELLDRRKSSEFRSKYWDNDEIEFYSAVEAMLKTNGVIDLPLGSRTVLKMYQALTNNDFIYFPKYRGLQFNAELDFKYNNLFADSTSKAFFHSLTLSAAYGVPIKEKLSVLAAAFIEIPLRDRYLENYPSFAFHSPVVLAESFQVQPSSSLNKIPYMSFRNSDLYSLRFASYVKAFYDISSTAGISFEFDVSTAKVLDGVYLAGGFGELALNYNIVSRLVLSAVTTFIKTYSNDYLLDGGIKINYVLL